MAEYHNHRIVQSRGFIYRRHVSNFEIIQEYNRIYSERVSEWMGNWGESNNNEDAEEEINNKKNKKKIDCSSSSSSNGILIASDDLLFSQILTRLPVKSLMRFKCVCKFWKSIIEKDANFISLHHTHSQSRPGFSIVVAPFVPRLDYYNDDKIRRGYDLSLLSAGLHSSSINVHTVKTLQSSVKCLGPVKGLLCFVDHFAVQICNVSTGEVTPWIKSNAEKLKYSITNLPRVLFLSTRSLQYCFGFDPSSGKHKVLCFWWNVKPVSTPHCEVLTVGVDSMWRIIDVVPPFKPCTVENIGAYADGSIYWLCKQGVFGSRVCEYSESLMAFDFGSEKFRMIPVPKFTYLKKGKAADTESENWDRSKELAMHQKYQTVNVNESYSAFQSSSWDGLVEMDGCLTVIRRRYQMVKIWKFHDYNKETTGSEKDWTQVADIRLPCDITSDVFLYFHPIPGKGQLILEAYVSSNLTNITSDESFKRNAKFARFYSYNLTNKTFRRLRIHGVSSFPEDSITTCATLVESLFPAG